jgi:drug/metabolite transporter (DMT)-like permease
MEKSRLYAVAQALLAATLFGASAPLSKLLLGEVQPIPLAAFLYLGSGLGLLLFRGLQHLGGQASKAGAQLTRRDVPWLLGAVFAGGVAAPIVLLFSLRNTPAVTASLLLNFESVATTLIAARVFHEAIGRRVWLAIALITAASVLLSWVGDGTWGVSLGALGILAACALWGMDNNFTRNIAAKDPFIIVIVKGLVAGGFSLLLALLLGAPLPSALAALLALLLGGFSYGLSIFLFVLAMRGLGAARTSALFGAAPFAGAGLSFLIFRDPFGALFWAAVPFMVGGTLLLVSEDHAHEHSHTAGEHEHTHIHDEDHHDHAHGAITSTGSHTHSHVHAAFSHSHPHAPDIHHRHGHAVVNAEKAPESG